MIYTFSDKNTVIDGDGSYFTSCEVFWKLKPVLFCLGPVNERFHNCCS